MYSMYVCGSPYSAWHVSKRYQIVHNDGQNSSKNKKTNAIIDRHYHQTDNYNGLSRLAVYS